MSSDYDKAAAELADLPRAERYDRLLDFPTSFAFKAIGESQAFGAAMRSLLDGLGHPNIVLVERPSKHGRYTSVTFTLRVTSGKEIDAIYLAIETLDALKLIL